MKPRENFYAQIKWHTNLVKMTFTNTAETGMEYKPVPYT